MTQKQPINQITEGVIWKQLLLFFFPILLGTFFQQLYNTIDTVIVGQFVGKAALASVGGSSAQIVALIVGFFTGLSSGASVLIAQYFGARNEHAASDGLHNAYAISIVGGILLGIIGFFATPSMLRLMNTPDEIMQDSVIYLRIYFAGIIFVFLYNMGSSILRAVGDSKRPLYYLIASSIVNVVLDILFIAVFHAGVGGAALATIISQFLSAFLCMFRLMKNKGCEKLYLRKIRFNWEMLKQIVRFGLPSGVQNSIIALANVVVQSNINSFGEMAMAGVGAFSKIEGFGFLPITSFTMAMTTFISQNLGAKQHERAKQSARFGIFMTALLAELIGVVVFIFAPQLIAAFDSNPAVVEIGVEKARTSALFFFLLAYSHAVSAILRGAGKAVVPMMVMMIFWCVVRVAFLMITVPLTHSIQMLYWVYPLTWGLSSLAFLWYYKKADWLHALD